MEKGPGPLKMFDRMTVTYSRKVLKGNKCGPISLEGLFVGWEERGGSKILSLKMGNGYNIGIDHARIQGIHVMEDEVANGSNVKKSMPRPLGKGTIALLSMGGTIASRVDYATGAVKPAREPEDLLSDLDTLGQNSDVIPRIVGTKLSEDMTPRDWSQLADEIVKAFSEGMRGCVVTHGTDTLSMTAAALSFILKDLPGPVVLVGSQRSSDRPSSDAFLNLKDAIIAARSEGIGEVVVLMHGSSSDDATFLHRGCRVRKMHTSRRDSFVSANSLPIGRIERDVLTLISVPKPPSEKGIRSEGGFDELVLVLRATPQLDRAILGYAMDHYRAIVIEGTGLGHIRSELIPMLSKAIEKGVPVVMTSSSPYGMVNLNVYATGRDLLEAGVIPAYDMSTEVAMVKSMYILAGMDRNAPVDIAAFGKAFLTDIAGELDMRTDPSSFGMFNIGQDPTHDDRRGSGT